MTRPSSLNGLPRSAFWLGLLIALACAGYATWVRLGQLDTWKSEPAVYFPGGVPAMMTTLDAYYSLRWAQAHLSGTFRPEADDPLRHHQTLQYPVGFRQILPDTGQPDWRPRREPLRLPALSSLLAAVQPYAGSVEMAGLYLIPILANLFIIPLLLYAQGVVGRGDFIPQPSFDCLIPRQQGAQAVTNDLALGGVYQGVDDRQPERLCGLAEEQPPHDSNVCDRRRG